MLAIVRTNASIEAMLRLGRGYGGALACGRGDLELLPRTKELADSPEICRTGRHCEYVVELAALLVLEMRSDGDGSRTWDVGAGGRRLSRAVVTMAGGAGFASRLPGLEPPRDVS